MASVFEELAALDRLIHEPARLAIAQGVQKAEGNIRESQPAQVRGSGQGRRLPVKLAQQAAGPGCQRLSL